MAASPTGCTLQFVGTATTVLRLGPFTVLTDPNFLHRGQWAYLGYGLVSRRRTEPALGIEELPPLDAIVLSHMHGDHWDRNARRGLDHGLPVFTTPAAARALDRQGFSAAVGMRTWAEQRLDSDGATLRITSMPGRHATGPARHLLPPVMGSMLELTAEPGAAPYRLYLSGDTLLVRDLEEIPRRYPDIDAAVLHLGGTRLPGGLLVTMDALQGVRAIRLIGADTHVPVHYDDYGVFKSPLAHFRAEVEERGLAGRVTWAERGQTVLLPPGTQK